MSNYLDLSYPAILNHMQKHMASGRTESRAFLAWFLENYLRLDDVDALDAICDGPDDKGVDGVYIDDNLEQVVILQSKLLQNNAKTLGDTQLKEFYGTLAQFRSPQDIVAIAQTTGNSDLRSLIETSRLADKVQEGYSVRGLYVTNVQADSNAKRYLETCSDLDLYDAVRLRDSYIPSEPTDPLNEPVTFDLYGYDVIEYKVGDVAAIFAPISAVDLLKLGGLQSGELFVWNVRRSLGRTKVNKEIATSIREQEERRNFMLYHNGITILCHEWNRYRDKLSIEKYTVVNGAQSLTSLYQNRSAVTEDLRILARIIRLPPDSELAGRVTHHSNNQNSISARDLQSTSSLQRRLQNEFARVYPKQVFYRIQRGEESELPIVIDNEDAARVMLAFDLQQPWTCHQTYKLFDELHTDIFARPEVNAQRIFALHITQSAVLDSLSQIKNEMLGKYRLTRYFMLYLLRQVLELDETGKQFVRDPKPFLAALNGVSRLLFSMKRVISDVIVDLNGELQFREEHVQPFDYKRELKAPSPVRRLAKDIVSPYQKAVSRDRATAFGTEWANSQ